MVGKLNVVASNGWPNQHRSIGDWIPFLTCDCCGIRDLNLLHTKSTPLSTELVAHKVNTFIYSLNLLHTNSTPSSTLWTCCTQSQHLYLLSEPFVHKVNTFIHSLNLLNTSSTPLFILRTFCPQVERSFLLGSSLMVKPRCLFLKH